MEELIKQVTERTGISQDQARTAVETVLGHLKKSLPASVSEHLDTLVGGGAGAVGDLAGRAGDIVGGLGGMLGGKKD
ncbi:MAG: hypothetical protein QOE33_1411 [Acidobacteriota bacterium]|nr:hypothetical protein [Acidobacteriota bacterium]